MKESSQGNGARSVAVCIGTYNQAQYLEECIESVLAQSRPVEEIWVSDDASTDHTPQVMERLCKLHPTVKYYRQPVNLGISENLSWVLAQPSTEFIGRIDSDDRLEPNFVATLMDLLLAYPQAGFAHGEILEMDSRGVRTKVRRLHRPAVFESAEESLRNGARGYRVAANCIFYRAVALRQADYYHANATWKCAEDWDLCMRLAIQGWGNVYAATPVANYRVWNDSEQIRFKRGIYEIEGVTNVYTKTLEPEYIRRGWGTRELEKNRRKKALVYADALDSPLISKPEREVYKARLRELGGSMSLSVAMFLAAVGLNPLLRCMRRAKVRLKDLVKACLRLISSRRKGANGAENHPPQPEFPQGLR